MTSQPGDSTAAGRGAAIFTYVLRGAGIGLVILVVFPFYRMLDAAEGGLVLNSVLTFAEVARTMLLYGGLIVILVSLVLARLLDPNKIAAWCAALGRTLVSISSAHYFTA